MCISQRVPKEEEKQYIESGLGVSKWKVGYKVLKVQKKGKKIVLRSQMAKDEWVPGVMFAKDPNAAGFTGGKMPNGDHGFHILCVKPNNPSSGDTVLKVKYDVNSVLAVGKDSAGGITCRTVVARLIQVDEADYLEALKGGPRVSKKKVKAVKKRVSQKMLIADGVNLLLSMKRKTSVLFVKKAKKDKRYSEIKPVTLRQMYKKAKTRIDITLVNLARGTKGSAKFEKLAKQKHGLTRDSARIIYRMAK